MKPVLKFTTRSSGFVSSVQPSRPAPSLAEVTVKSLVEAGFDHCFGIPGRHVQALFHHLAHSGVRCVLSRHEQGAAFMADGFARASGRPAIVAGTAGPGATNMLTGVANAYAERIPMLCLTGAAPTLFGSRGAFQELGDDHTSLTPAVFAPVTRYNAQIGHTRQIGPALQLAMTALAEGGPVNLSFPSDLLEQPAAPVRLSRPFKLAHQPDGETVAAAAALLANNPNVLILAGRGALGASAALTALAEKLQAPVMTTVHGRGAIDEDHPLALGAQGFSASNWAEHYLAEHRPSVVLAVGTSLREISTNVYHPAFGGTLGLIHCTRDPQAIGRHYQTTVGVVADAEAFLSALLPLVEPSAANEALAAFKARVPRFDDAAQEQAAGNLSPRCVVESLRRAIGPDDALVVDTGNAVPWSIRYYPVRRAGTYFASLHLATMGWGVAAAIGVQLARPERRVVALVGDGCFQMAGMEVASAVQHDVPVVWVVLNDARLNMVFQGSEGYYGQAIPNTELSAVDCARIAEGLGAAGFRVDRPEDLDDTIAEALACGRPAVVDVAIHPGLRPPMAGRFDGLRRFESE